MQQKEKETPPKILELLIFAFFHFFMHYLEKHFWHSTRCPENKYQCNRITLEE